VPDGVVTFVVVVVVPCVFVTGTGASTLTGVEPPVESGGNSTIVAESLETGLTNSPLASAVFASPAFCFSMSSFFQTEHPPDTQREVHFSFVYGFDTPICVVVVSVCSTVRLEFPQPHNTTTPSKARNRFMDCPPTSPAQRPAPYQGSAIFGRK